MSLWETQNKLILLGCIPKVSSKFHANMPDGDCAACRHAWKATSEEKSKQERNNEWVNENSLTENENKMVA
jgi:hypothetical protein